MSQVITIKTDAETKKAAQDLAKELGLTLSTLINSYLKQVIVTRRVELYAPEPMTPKLTKLLKESEAEIRRGDIGQEYDDVNEFLASLRT